MSSEIKFIRSRSADRVNITQNAACLPLWRRNRSRESINTERKRLWEMKEKGEDSQNSISVILGKGVLKIRKVRLVWSPYVTGNEARESIDWWNNTQTWLYIATEREKRTKKRKRVMKHSRVSISGDSVHVAMDSVTHPPIAIRVLRTSTSDWQKRKR